MKFIFLWESWVERVSSLSSAAGHRTHFVVQKSKEVGKGLTSRVKKGFCRERKAGWEGVDVG